MDGLRAAAAGRTASSPPLSLSPRFTGSRVMPLASDAEHTRSTEQPLSRSQAQLLHIAVVR